MSKLLLVVLYILWCETIAAGISQPTLQRRKHVDIADFPYHVSVRRAGRHVCSGALVHESWIITAASCVYDSSVPRVSVAMGSSELQLPRHRFNVSKIVVHQTFDKDLLTGNIALLEIKPSVSFVDSNLLPIFLPSSENYHLKDGSVLRVSGWARLQRAQKEKPDAAAAKLHSGGFESQLSVTGASLVNQRTCIRSMPSYKAVSGKMLCAGNPNAKETCQGDIGAPLANHDILVGILSLADGCLASSYPAVYTKISSFLPWIAKILSLHTSE
ncbi:hypothetical protein TSAR_000682 [Trichomalopsis sarcophagae]|uniref:trypsin n=1 Tax=Trichomalopsis sarcophagae TaxID=543379 RepID=A0A232EUP1_9HYME|nr:hypothetical protein TSAR_000682 [Trichomalopsis sarcophagae]